MATPADGAAYTLVCDECGREFTRDKPRAGNRAVTCGSVCNRARKTRQRAAQRARAAAGPPEYPWTLPRPQNGDEPMMDAELARLRQRHALWAESLADAPSLDRSAEAVREAEAAWRLLPGERPSFDDGHADGRDIDPRPLQMISSKHHDVCRKWYRDHSSEIHMSALSVGQTAVRVPSTIGSTRPSPAPTAKRSTWRPPKPGETRGDPLARISVRLPEPTDLAGLLTDPFDALADVIERAYRATRSTDPKVLAGWLNRRREEIKRRRAAGL